MMDKSKIAVDVFNKLANEYQHKFMDVNLYGNTFDFFCNNLVIKNPQILEIACGPGNITKYLLKKRPDFKILGMDLSLNMIGLAKINNPKAEFILMDCRKINVIDKKYDGIMCGFCLPYLSKKECVKLISDSYKLLQYKGLLYLSTMEDDYSKSGFKKGSGGDEIYMHYYQADFLTAVLKENHFNILNLQRIDTTTSSGTKTTDLIIIAEK